MIAGGGRPRYTGMPITPPAPSGQTDTRRRNAGKSPSLSSDDGLLPAANVCGSTEGSLPALTRARSRCSSFRRARIAAKSSAARGRVTFPPDPISKRGSRYISLNIASSLAACGGTAAPANAAYQHEKGQETTTSYAASSTLAKQIKAAVPADIFIPAIRDSMGYLANRNSIEPETRANLLGNCLVLIAPLNSTPNPCGKSHRISRHQ